MRQKGSSSPYSRTSVLLGVYLRMGVGHLGYDLSHRPQHRLALETRRADELEKMFSAVGKKNLWSSVGARRGSDLGTNV